MRRAVMRWAVLFLIPWMAFAEGIVGLWTTVNENTGQKESVIGIYEYQGLYYGRIVATYDNGRIDETLERRKERAPGVPGNPYYVGMDIIWGLRQEGNRYVGGSILDPEHGQVYDAEAWRDGENLVVRGELLIFGRNQVWPPFVESDYPAGFKRPDLSTFVPDIPQL